MVDNIDNIDNNIKKDELVPFSFNNASIRGRVIFLNESLNNNEIEHPDEIKLYLAESMLVCSLFASCLDFDGCFKFEIRTSGLIPLLVVEIDSKGVIRSSVSYDKNKLEESLKDITSKEVLFRKLFEDGILLFTVLPKSNEGNGYQGSIKLEGYSIVSLAEDYFSKSQQIETTFKIASHINKEGVLYAGGILIQKMPVNDIIEKDEQSSYWERFNILLDTVKNEELYSSEITSKALLTRLYGLEEVMTYEGYNITYSCKCSKEKTDSILKNLPRQDQEEILEEGSTSVTCNFCGKEQKYTKEDLVLLFSKKSKDNEKSENLNIESNSKVSENKDIKDLN